MITTLRLQSTRRQLAEMPMLALILPVQEIPEKLPDFTPSNKFIDFMDVLFKIFGLLFGENKDNKDYKKTENQSDASEPQQAKYASKDTHAFGRWVKNLLPG